MPELSDEANKDDRDFAHVRQQLQLSFTLRDEVQSGIRELPVLECIENNNVAGGTPSNTASGAASASGDENLARRVCQYFNN